MLIPSFYILRFSKFSAIVLTVLIFVSSLYVIPQAYQMNSAYFGSATASASLILILLISTFAVMRAAYALVLQKGGKKYFVMDLKTDLKSILTYSVVPPYFRRLSVVKMIMIFTLTVFYYDLYFVALSKLTSSAISAPLLWETTIKGFSTGCLAQDKTSEVIQFCDQTTSFLTQNRATGFFVLIMLGFGLYIFLAGRVRYFTERLSRTSVDAAIRRHGKAPILYLRPFSLDRMIMRRPRLDVVDQLLDISSKRQPLDQVVLEEMSVIGPVIGLGDPRDKSQPVGIAREYILSGNWKDRLDQLLQDAANIVICVADTPHVLYEIEQIASRNKLEQTIFLFPSEMNQDAFRHVLEKISEAAKRPLALSSLGRTPGGRLGARQDRLLALRLFDLSRPAVVLTSQQFTSDEYRMALRGLLRAEQLETARQRAKCTSGRTTQRFAIGTTFYAAQPQPSSRDTSWPQA